jgi:hypothetical protein
MNGGFRFRFLICVCVMNFVYLSYRYYINEYEKEL